jgi:hypothetical protein
MQDEGRKRKSPNHYPGPWAGAISGTSKVSVTKSVPMENWLKGNEIVKGLMRRLDCEAWGQEVARGFLGHVSTTFDVMVPYSKGSHRTKQSNKNSTILKMKKIVTGR